MDKKKMIGDIVTSITDKELKKDYFYNAVPLAVILGKDAKEGTLWAAFASYAPGCKMIEVAAICDNTILGSGKKGILFSTEGIYGSMFNKNRKQGPIAMPIKYEELDSARPSPRDKSEVELVFKGGRVEKIYVYTYTGFVITALNRILEELKREKEREKEEKIRKIQQEKQYKNVQQVSDSPKREKTKCKQKKSSVTGIGILLIMVILGYVFFTAGKRLLLLDLINKNLLAAAGIFIVVAAVAAAFMAYWILKPKH